MADLISIAPSTAACKICGASSGLFGVVDFNKNCEARWNQFPLPMSGVPIYYHRCSECLLIVTTAFDELTADDFLRHIYNDRYGLVRPDYATIRPQTNARLGVSLFGASRHISILDYGGGNGRSAELLRQAGFADLQTYDPFVPAASTLPARQFELVTCFEVAGHSHTPMKTFAQMASLVSPEGLILFTTDLHLAEIGSNLDWWYAAPRNGHVTLYNR